MTSTPTPLTRTVGLSGAVWMGLGSILGTGVFVSLGVAAGVAGAGIVVAVVLAALVATSNGLASAQLAAVHPVSGATYAYGHRFVHPIAGFTAGWMFLAAKTASAATAALGCSSYLLRALAIDPAPWLRVALALALVAATTLLTAGGLKRSNAVNIAIVSLTLTALAAFTIFGALSVDPAQLPARLGADALTDAFASPTTLLHATALLFVAFTGYGRIATLGEEVRDPARTVPRAILITLALTLLLYLAVAATALATVGPEAFARATREAAAPLETVAHTFNTPVVATLVAAGAVTAMAGVLLNLLLGLSRVLLAMARNHEAPRQLAHIEPHTGSPRRAVLAIGALIAALVLIGDVKATWSFSAFTVLIYYSITHLAALRLPPQARRLPRALSALGLLACLSLAFFVEWPVWLTGLAMIAAGFVWRAIMLRLQHPT